MNMGSDMKPNFVATSFGRIHYLEAGSGEPLILLHSNGCSAHEFADVVEPLGKRFRTIAWDMPGHGDSDPITRHMTIDDYADAVIAFMDALGIDKAHVSGTSVGGTICVALGARYPERMKSVIIVETAFRTFDEWGTDWLTVETIFGNPSQTLEQIKPRFRNATPSLLQRWNIDRNKAGARTMVDVMWAIREYDMQENIGKVSVPSACIFGEKGPVLGTIGRFRDGLAPGGRQIMMADCGHFPMIDDPDAFTTAMIEAIEG